MKKVFMTICFMVFLFCLAGCQCKCATWKTAPEQMKSCITDETGRKTCSRSPNAVPKVVPNIGWTYGETGK